jgi:magnesium transporter
MIRKYLKQQDSLDLHESTSFQKGAWVNVDEASQENIDEIANLVGLTVEDLADSLDPFELPRVETQEHSLLIFIRTPGQPRKGSLHTDTLSIIVSPDYFITISASKNEIIHKLKDSDIDFSAKDFEDPLIFILNETAKNYMKKIRVIRKSLDAQRKDIQNIDDEDILTLIENEEVLNQYLASLVPMKIAIENLHSYKNLQFDESERDLFQDTINNIKQSIDICTVNLKSIRSLRDSYQIIFTNRLNRKITFLTGFTIIMTMPTIVASIFGMNVHLPFESSSHAFGIILTLAFGSSFLMLLYFIWKKLL